MSWANGTKYLVTKHFSNPTHMSIAEFIPFGSACTCTVYTNKYNVESFEWYSTMFISFFLT